MDANIKEKGFKPMLSAILAMAENRVIGFQNQLPWHLPADLKHFKTITTGHPILMGRKTYESIGKPLPNRLNIILTRDAALTIPGCLVVTSTDEALNAAMKVNQQEIFVIGGAEIFKQLLPKIERIYLTIIHHPFVGDVFFPELDLNAWRETMREDYQADANNAFAYSFLQLQRINDT